MKIIGTSSKMGTPSEPSVNEDIFDWTPEPLELARLKLGATVQVSVIAPGRPVVSIGVGAAPARPREEFAAKVSRIQALMDALESGPAITLQHETDEAAFEANEKVFTAARRLILDLLGISSKPVGEQIADVLADLARREAAAIAGGADAAAGSLEDMLTFTKRWLPECFSAEDNGQVPFARVLCESLVEAAEAHLRREAKARRAAVSTSRASEVLRDALSDD